MIPRMYIHTFLVLLLAISSLITSAQAKACTAKLDFVKEEMNGKNVGSLDIPAGKTLTHKFYLKNNSNCNASSHRLKIHSIYPYKPGFVGKIVSDPFSIRAGEIGSVNAVYDVPQQIGSYKIEFEIFNNYDKAVPPLSGYKRLYSQIQVKAATVTRKPDLTITDFSRSSANLTVNEYFTLKATAKNIGDLPAKTAIIRYYLSDNSIISFSDQLLSSKSIISLSSNRSTTKETSVKITKAGSFYVGACVTKLSNEKSTTNNCSYGQRIVVKDKVVSKPDLTVPSFTKTVSRVNKGTSFRLDAVVKNTGSGSSSSTTLQYLYSTSRYAGSSDKRIGSDGVSSLSANRSSNENVYVQINETGTFYVRACVVSVANETSTSNNCSHSLQITVENPSKILQVPSTRDFTSINVGSSIVRTLLLENKSNSTITVQTPSLRNGFTLAQPFNCHTIQANKYCNISVRFSPTVAKRYSESIQIVSNATNSPARVTLTGTGVQVNRILQVPSTRDFTSVNVGSSTIRTLLLENKSNSAITVQTPNLRNGFELVQPFNCRTISTNGYCYLSIRFSPTVAKRYSESIQIVSNATNSPARVTLTGTGTEDFTLVLPRNLDFGEVKVGNTATREITLTNPSRSQELRVAPPSVSQGFEVGTFNCKKIAPGNQCKFAITFTPTRIHNYSSSTNLDSNADNSSVPISLTAYGIQADQPIISITSTAHDFESVEIGQVKTHRFELSNSGNAPLTINSISQINEFTANHNCYNIQPAGSCQVTVSFNPKITQGHQNKAITLYSNASPNVNTLFVNGVGVEPKVARMTIHPPSHDFGSATIGHIKTHIFEITNSGNAPLIINSITPSNDLPSGEITIPNPCTRVQPRDSCRFIVYFISKTVSNFINKAIIINSNASPSVSNLLISGAGVQPKVATIAVNSPSHNFESVEIGQVKTHHFELSNSGNAPLTINSITSNDEFTVSHNCRNIQPRGSCQVTVSFSPKIVQSHVNNPITLHSNASPSVNTLHVSGLGKEKKVATISYTNPVTFDSVEIGKSTSKTVEITNTGNAPLTSFVMGNLTNVKADVPRDCATLAASAKCSITLTFTPNEVKNETLTLPFTSSATNNGGQHSISLKTQVTKTPAKLTLTPSELDFSDIEIGKTSLKKIFTLTNKGMDTLSLEVPTALPEGFQFTVVDCDTPLVLPENKSCQVEVIFAPTEVKTYDTTLAIKPIDTKVKEQVLTLKGTGIPKPTVSLKVTISEANSGLVTTEPSGAMVCANDICQGSYTVNEKVKVTARPNPGFGFTQWSGSCQGAQPETEVILDTAKNCTASFTQLTANLTLDPATPQDFGDVKVGDTSAPKTFTLTNAGDADATLTSYKTTKPEFVVTDVNQCLTKPITKNGGTCKLEVIFKPTKGEPVRDYLVIDSSVGKLPTVELSGFGKIIEKIFRLVAVMPPETDLAPGSTFQITFKFMADDEINADGVAMSTYYDISKLEALKITNKNAFDMEIYSEIVAEEGRIDFMVMNGQSGLAPNEPFDLFTVDFKVKEDVKPDDTTEITFGEDNVYIDGYEYIAMKSDPIKLTFKGILDKEELDFGKVSTIVAEPKVLEINIKNARNSVLLIDNLSFSPAEAALTIDESCGNEVAAHSECTLQVKFKPEEVRNYSTELKVDYHYADTEAQTASAAIVGEGVAPAKIKVEFDWYKHVGNDDLYSNWKVPLKYWIGEESYMVGDKSIMTGEVEVDSTGSFDLPSELLTEDKNHCIVIKAKNSLYISYKFNPTTSNIITIPSDVKPLVLNGFSTDPQFKEIENQLGFNNLTGTSFAINNILNGQQKISAAENNEHYHSNIVYDLNADGEIYINSQKGADNFTDKGDIAWLQSVFRTQFEKRVLDIKKGVFVGSKGCSATPVAANTLPTSRREGLGEASLFTTPMKNLSVGSVQQVDVQLKSKTPARFLGANVVLTFDPKQIEVTNLTIHPHFESPTLYKIYPDEGIIFGMLHTFRFSDETKFTEMNIMSFEVKTLVEGGEKTLQFHHGAEQMAAIGENLDNIVTIRDAEVLSDTIDSIGDPGEIPECPIYGIQDNGINNTQFFVMNPITRKVMTLGDEHKKADIEGMAVHPETGQLYGSSGDKTEQKGHLYLIDKETGSITSIGATGFKEVDGITFDPSGALWGSAVGEGLISINPDTAESELVLPFKEEIEDMVFSPDGKTLYAAQDSTIWAFDGKDINIVCSNLPNQIEALHVVPGNALMFSFHHDQRGYINVLDIDTCEVVIEQGLPTGLNDIEGLTWVPSCLTDAP